MKKLVHNLFHVFPKILRDRKTKSIPKIFIELLRLSIYERVLPIHYFSRFLFLKNNANVNNFIPDQVLQPLHSFYNQTSYRSILDNKLLFYKYFNDLNIPTVSVLFYNIRNSFFYEGKITNINTFEAFRKLILNVLEKYKLDSLFIKKTTETGGGHHIYKIDKIELEKDSVKSTDIYDQIVSADFIFQPVISQHTELSSINPSSVNTIRMDTFVDKLGKAYLLSAFLRMGTSRHYVDNICSGGCYASIDMESGKLKGEAYTTFSTGGGIIRNLHPTSKIVFSSFKVPLFDEVKKLVKRTAELVPNQRLIGWDVAVTESGPILIEGNPRYCKNSMDLAFGGYKSHPVFRKVLEEAGYNKFKGVTANLV